MSPQLGVSLLFGGLIAYRLLEANSPKLANRMQMIDFIDYILFQNPISPLVVGRFGDWMIRNRQLICTAEICDQ